MNWLDIVIGLVLVVSILLGLATGLVGMLISLAGLILGIFLAGKYYQALAGRLIFIPSDTAARIVAYVVILVVVIIVAAIVAGLVSRLVSAISLGWLDRLGGAVFGLVETAIFIGAILAIWTKYGGGGDIVGNSFLGRFLLDKFPLVLDLLPSEFGAVKAFFK